MAFVATECLALSALLALSSLHLIACSWQVVFVLGGPGAGKGTQCANIVKVNLVPILLALLA